MLELLLIRLVVFTTGYILLSVFVFGLLRLHDYVLGVDFKQSFTTIKSEPKALAIYYGCRMLAVYGSVVMILVLCFIL